MKSPHLGIVVIGVVAIVLVLVIFIAFWASRYAKVGPNQVLVVSGKKHALREADGTVRSIGFLELSRAAARLSCPSWKRWTGCRWNC